VTRNDDDLSSLEGAPADGGLAEHATDEPRDDAGDQTGPMVENSEDEIASFEEEKTSPEVRARPQRPEDKRPVGIVALGDVRRRRGFAEALRADGWNAVEASDVDELLEFTKTLGPHLVLADADLRRGDKTIARALRRQRHEAMQRLVGVVRDETDPGAAGRALADGFDDFVGLDATDAVLVARANANLQVARSVAELNKQRRDASLLLELTQTLASSLDMGLILHTVSRLISEVLGLERCSIILLDSSADEAVMVAASDDRSVRDLRISLSSYPELKLCVESAAPVLIDDVAATPVLEHVAKSLVDRGVRKQALFPIVHEENVIGLLFLRSAKRALQLGQHEIQFAQTVASTCATAIRNARLFDQFRDRHHHIETMREQAERQTEALRKYQDFFEYAADGIAVIDVDGGVHYVNKEGRRLLGRSWDDLRSVRFPTLLLADSARLWPELVAQVRHGRFRRSFDVGVRIAQQQRVLSLSAGGVGQGTGLLILSFRDVTELRGMEGELRTTKEFLENLIDSSVDAIVAADMSGNIILFNKGAEKVYGYKAADVIGAMHVEQLYPDGGAEEVMRRLRDERWGGRGRLAPERREIRVASGEVVPVSMSASIIYEDGEESATVGVFTDLRDRMAIERQLSEARDLLTRAEKARVAAELAGMAAHELNQPLTSVLGYAEMLRTRVPESDTRIRRPVDTIFQQAERMAEIVRKIGSITKYETKRYGANTDMIDLNRAADAVPTNDPSERVDSLSRTDEDRRPGAVAPATPVSESARRTTTQNMRVHGVLGASVAELSSPLPPAPDGEQLRTDPPRALTPPASPGPGKRSDSSLGALAAMLGPRTSSDPLGRDPRSAIVRMDTVDEKPAGYAQRLQRAQAEVAAASPLGPAASLPASSPAPRPAPSAPVAPTTGSFAAPELPAAPPPPTGTTPPGGTPFPSRPAPRALAFEQVLSSNREGEQHTNPGVRLSDLRRRAREENER